MSGTPSGPGQERRWVLHVDMDQFVAAVEVLRRPELAGRPVIVGGRGDPTERAVVSTASYEAREHGVRSGMALRIAARRCPEAVFLPVDAPVYEAASHEVMETLRAVPGAVVEVLGWDEAFVGVRTDDPEQVARRLQAAVLDATRLHCSVGIGDTKVRAKVATDFGKPRGTFTLTRENWLEVMGERAVTSLWGVGPRTAARLEPLGVRTVSELAAAADDVLAAEFGPSTGPHIGRLGRGEQQQQLRLRRQLLVTMPEGLLHPARHAEHVGPHLARQTLGLGLHGRGPAQGRHPALGPGQVTRIGQQQDKQGKTQHGSSSVG